MPYSVTGMATWRVCILRKITNYKCERNFYCSAKEFLEKTDARDVLLMRDDKGNTIRVIPSGFHNYGNFFNADDLISAGLFVQEIDYLQRKK